jgi:lysophospholipase L1-like esterase
VPQLVPSTVKFMPVKDSIIVASDRLIGNFNLPSLNANQSRQQKAKVSLKSSFPTGTYYIGVLPSLTSETNVENNAAVDSVTITLQKNNGGNTDALFTNIVGVGDSLLAGFIDGSLVEQYQVHNFGSKLSEQANSSFTLPLISDPGNPALRVVMNNGQIRVLNDLAPGQRLNPNTEINNFSVPGISVFASLNVKNLNSGSPETDDPFYIVLGGNKTQIQSAVDSGPSLIILWLGSNDVLGMVLNSDPSDHTSVANFRRDLQQIINRLKGTGAKIVAANLPDVTTIPFLMDSDDWSLLTNLGLPDGGKIPATLILDFLIKGNIPNLTDDVILTSAELNQIRQTVEQLNSELVKLYNDNNIPYVDMFEITRNWSQNGITVNGQKLTMDWQGGLFSLDGIHPTITAHAIIANRFIDLINQEFNKNLPKTNVATAMNADPNFNTTSSNRQKQKNAALAVNGIKELQRYLKRNKEIQHRFETRKERMK